ncbi:MAG: stage IV sporulation protein A [Clostridia bacterium]|nr:stage IV sporulation protein A [Clostridia bacterium]
MDNNVYEDIAARCGGDICICVTEVGTTTSLAERFTAVFAEDNSKVRFTDSAPKASFGVIVISDDNRDVPTEENAVHGFKSAKKPFVLVLNTSARDSSALKTELEGKYSVPVVMINAGHVSGDAVMQIMRAALFEFPVTSFDINIPDWMRYLSTDCSAVAELLGKVRAVAPKICKMKDCSAFDDMLSGCEYWVGEPSVNMNLAEGKVELTVTAKDGIYFGMLSEIAGDTIGDECSLMRYVRATSEAKRSYDKIKDAYECAKINGYGIVEPDDSDMSLDKPQVVKQGGSVGIKLKATAPSYHIVKVDVTGEVSPIMGNARQSEGIVEGMMNGFETNPEGMWETNVFGKSLRGMVKEGLAGKVCGMHDETKTKMRRAMTRIINEGKGGVICILL